MVRRSAQLLGAVFALSVCPTPVLAQDFLDKIGQDVAAVVKKIRGAVVAIEDDRPFKQFGGVDVDLNIAEALKEAEKSLDRETRRAQRTSPNGPGSPEENARAKAETANRIAGLQEQLKTLHQKLKVVVPNSVRLMVDAPKSGTGFCIGDGYVVTTADVLQGMRVPIVITDDGTRVKANILRCDTELNVGLLKLPGEARLDSLKWGDSTSVQVGHFAISIGNQSGQINSVSLSIVSGIRTEGTFAGSHFYPSLIQVNGTVGAGSSGAPLVNPRGELIGMMAGVPAGEWTQTRLHDMIQGFLPDGLPGAKSSGARSRVSIRSTGKEIRESPTEEDPQQGNLTFIRPPVTSAGFALPVNFVREAVEKLKGGRLVRGWIGITPMDFRGPGAPGSISSPERIVVIKNVHADSPACKAGIRVNDIILSINGKKLEEANEVRAISSTLKPGDKMTIVVRRAGEQKVFNLAIEARPEPTEPDREKVKPKKTGLWEVQPSQPALPAIAPLPPCDPSSFFIPPREVEADTVIPDTAL